MACGHIERANYGRPVVPHKKKKKLVSLSQSRSWQRHWKDHTSVLLCVKVELGGGIIRVALSLRRSELVSRIYRVDNVTRAAERSPRGDCRQRVDKECRKGTRQKLRGGKLSRLRSFTPPWDLH